MQIFSSAETGAPSSFNPARTLALKAFCATLAELKGKAHVTEAQFRDAWLERLREEPSLFASGWYDPPPDGLAVLFASGDAPQRISFESLRDPQNWPGDTEADWNGFLFAYASCVDRATGLLGDFDVTLYFGDDPKLKAHYKNCHRATAQLLDSLRPTDTSRAIFRRAQDLFEKAGLQNCVVSVTDTVSLDLGHSFPSLPQDARAAPDLTEPHKNALRTARLFLNDATDWPLTPGQEFTIEPQLRSQTDPTLPQISFHYLVRVNDHALKICRDIDALIEPLLRS